MAISNHERVGGALELLKTGVGPFVDDPERAHGARDDLLALARPRAAAPAGP